MDSFSPGGRFSQTHESLTNGTVDEIIRESSDDIDHRSIIDQWPPVGQRKQGLFFILFCWKSSKIFKFEFLKAHQIVQKCVGVILNFSFSYSDKLINMYSSAVLKRAFWQWNNASFSLVKDATFLIELMFEKLNGFFSTWAWTSNKARPHYSSEHRNFAS